MFGPEVGAAFGINKLGVDPDLIAARLDRAFEHVANAQVPANSLGVDRLALVGQRSIARDHEGIADARDARGQCIGERVGEVILRRIAGKIGEG